MHWVLRAGVRDAGIRGTSQKLIPALRAHTARGRGGERRNLGGRFQAKVAGGFVTRKKFWNIILLRIFNKLLGLRDHIQGLAIGVRLRT